MKCAYCNKSIQKRSVTVYVHKEPTEYHRPFDGIRYHYYGDKTPPLTKADCQRLTNREVISINRSDVYNGQLEVIGKRLNSWNEWDGESYAPSYSFFCSNNCAGWYAKRAVERLNQERNMT